MEVGLNWVCMGCSSILCPCPDYNQINLLYSMSSLLILFETNFIWFRVQNRAANWRDHILPVQNELHWLLIHFWEQSEVLILISLNSLGPRYFRDCLLPNQHATQALLWDWTHSVVGGNQGQSCLGCNVTLAFIHVCKLTVPAPTGLSAPSKNYFVCVDFKCSSVYLVVVYITFLRRYLYCYCCIWATL